MKSIKITLTLFMFMFSGVLGLYANGDPTTQLSALYRSANPAPRTLTDIHVVREELRIKPGIYTEVSVRYFLWNASGNDYTDIDYAFPVDYQGTGDKYINSKLIGDFYSESSSILGWHDDYIKEITFRANRNLLPFEVSPEIVLYKPDKPVVQDPQLLEVFGEWTEEEAKTEYISQTVGRKWFYTRFNIGAGETMILDVNYSLRNETSFPTYEYLDRNWLASTFHYDMSPAAHWGNGIAREIDIEIDCSQVSDINAPDELAWFTTENGSLQFTKEDDKLVFRTCNFDFSTAKPIYFSYRNPSFPSLEEWMLYRIPDNQYTVTTSLENSSYPASNLTDMNLQTAWAVQWNEGEKISITIRFKNPVVLGAILVLGGYHKSEKTFYENCRPGKVHASAKTLIDEFFDPQTGMYVRGNAVESTETYSSHNEVSRVYRQVGFKNLIEYTIHLQRVVFDQSKIKEITLTLADIIPGTKYKDLCVSELILLDDRIFLSKTIGRED